MQHDALTESKYDLNPPLLVALSIQQSWDVGICARGRREGLWEGYRRGFSILCAITPPYGSSTGLHFAVPVGPLHAEDSTLCFSLQLSPLPACSTPGLTQCPGGDHHWCRKLQAPHRDISLVPGLKMVPGLFLWTNPAAISLS